MFSLAAVIESIVGETLGVERVSALTFSEVVVQAGAVEDGALFVNLAEVGRGDVIAEAVARGAAGVILQGEVGLREQGSKLDLRRRPIKLFSNGLEEPVWLIVEDARAALKNLARGWRKRQQGTAIVAVVGRGNVRPAVDMIVSVLEQRYAVLRDEERDDEALRVSLALLKLRSDHQRMVLRAGRHAEAVADLARPDLALVAGGADHGSTYVEEVKHLLTSMPDDGAAILNGDHLAPAALFQESPTAGAGLASAQQSAPRTFTYGLVDAWDLWADEVESFGVEGTAFWLHREAEKLHVRIPYFGRPAVHSALAGAAVGVVDGLSLGECVAGLQALPARVQVLTRPGPRSSTLIDDTYSATPDSSIAALNLLDELEGRKIAVLGGLSGAEGGEERGHERVGGRAAQVVEVLVGVGEGGRLIGAEALVRGMGEQDVVFAADNAEAIDQLRSLLQREDLVLIKGAKELEMGGIVDALAAPGERA